ncbi:CopG family transcriptional regulator [Thalassotalea agariperforans]
MSKLSKRSTAYFESDRYQALKMREDQEDLATLSERANEPEISYEDLLNDLKSHEKI